jgi:hypothetical protein
VGFTIYSLPRAPQERIEYLQMIAEEIVAKVATPTTAPATGSRGAGGGGEA